MTTDMDTRLTLGPDPVESLAAQASELAAVLQQPGSGCTIINADGGYQIASTRNGPAASILATRTGPLPISARDLDVLASAMQIPHDAQWNILRLPAGEVTVQVASCTFTLQ